MARRRELLMSGVGVAPRARAGAGRGGADQTGPRRATALAQEIQAGRMHAAGNLLHVRSILGRSAAKRRARSAETAPL